MFSSRRLAADGVYVIVNVVLIILQVMMAVGITSALCFALTLFALQTRWDFTAIGGILISLLVVLLIFSKY